MKTLAVSILTLALTVSFVFAGTTLTPERAGKYMGGNATVSGVVTQVVSIPKGTFVKFGGNSSKQVFTAVILAANRPQFGNFLKNLTGKKVIVSGHIDRDRYGNPEIIVTSPMQIGIAK